jgi:hypothetical protein
MNEVRMPLSTIIQAPLGLNDLCLFLVGTGILANPWEWMRWDDPITGDVVFSRVTTLL